MPSFIIVLRFFFFFFFSMALDVDQPHYWPGLSCPAPINNPTWKESRSSWLLSSWVVLSRNIQSRWWAALSQPSKHDQRNLTQSSYAENVPNVLMGRLLTRACQNERAWNGSFTLGPLHNNNNGPKENKKKKKRKNYAIAIELIPLPRWRLVTFTDESRWRWGRWASRLSGSIDVSAKEMARRGRAQSESLSSLAHTHISFVCVCVCWSSSSASPLLFV